MEQFTLVGTFFYLFAIRYVYNEYKITELVTGFMVARKPKVKP